MKTRMPSIICACAAVLGAAGCAAPKKAIYASPQFTPAAVAQVAVLPIVDSRVGKAEPIELQKDVGGYLRSRLEDRGYTVQFASTFGDVGTVSDVDLQSPDAAWIRRLGPPDARYVLVVMLMDLKSTLTFGSTGNAEVSGYLFDRADGVMLWHDKGIGQVGQGGLLGMAFKGGMASDALRVAVADMVSSLPERRK